MTNTQLKLLERYVDGTLTEEHAVELRRLLLDSPAARAKLRTLAAVEFGLQDLAAGAPVPDLSSRATNGDGQLHSSRNNNTFSSSAMNMQRPAELAEPESLQELKQIDRICVEFEQAWSEGREEQIEKRLASYTGAVRQQLLWELLAIELHYRRRRGESPAAEVYQHRFPDSAELIEAVYRDADAKNVAAAAARPSSKQNKEEWRRLIQIYGPTVYRWCRSDGLQPSESADIVHKVFTAAALRVPEFRRERPGNSFRGWLWTVYRSQVNHLVCRHQNEPPEPGGTKLHQDEPELASAVSALAELPVLTQTMPLRPGDDASCRFIRDYQLIEKLGEGGMGTVYLALHTWLEKPVAVKILRVDRERSQETISRFLREMRAVGKLEHPHIVRALDAGEDRGVHFLVMEYVAGVDLSRVANELGPLSVTDTCEIIRQAALGLQHAHENDLVHRDVKPSNLMLSPEGGVKVLDLGLAHFRRSIHESQELTRDGQVMGTFWYVAPEQLSPGRSVNAGCDVYSLGMTFRELLWPGAPKEVGVLGTMDPALRYLRRDVPDDLWRLLQQMTAVAQRERPAMAEVAASLAPFAENADPVALFRRCADQAAQRVRQGDPLSPPVQADRPTTEPPPSTARMSATETAPPAPRERPPARATAPDPAGHNRLWYAACALSTLVALLAAAIVLVIINPAPDDVQDLSSGPDGSDRRGGGGGGSGGGEGGGGGGGSLVGVIYIDISEGDLVAEKLLDNHLVWAEPTTNDRNDRPIRIQRGENNLPEGDYRLFVKATSEFETGVKLDNLIAVQSGNPLEVTLRWRLERPWLHPQVAERAGAFAAYTGTLWHPHLLLDSEDSEVSYDVTLKFLETVREGGAELAWLMIEVIDNRDNYTEVGYLLIDLPKWQNQGHLEVKRGWIQASRSDWRDDGAPGHEMVVEFDPDVDQLAKLAAQKGFDLRPDRLNVHQVMVLFFSAPFGVVPAEIRGLRGAIAADSRRRCDLRPVTYPLGVLDCLIVDSGSENAAKQLYCLARNESVPFSFVQVDVNHEIFRAHLKLTGLHRGNDAPESPEWPEGTSEGKLRTRAVSLLAMRNVNQRFDRARLPDPGAKAVYKVNSAGLEFATIVKALKYEDEESKTQLWIEISVESGDDTDMFESKAILLIDRKKYATGEPGESPILRGWWQAQDETFAYDPETGTGVAEEGLLRLGGLGSAPLSSHRFGVDDVLTLMFDIGPGSNRFADLRGTISAEIARSKEGREKSRGEVTTKEGKTLEVEVWEPPASLRGRIDYEIKRCRNIPFNFYSVIVEVPARQMLFSAVQTKSGKSEFHAFSEEDLILRAAETSRRLKEITTAGGEDWRVWNWTDGRTSWMLSAEYGGVKSDQVILRYGDGIDRRIIETVRLSQLAPQDLDWIAKGRLWTRTNGKRLRAQFRGWIDRSRQGGRIQLLVDGEKKTILIPFEDLSEEDQAWLEWSMRARTHVAIVPPRPRLLPKATPGLDPRTYMASRAKRPASRGGRGSSADPDLPPGGADRSHERAESTWADPRGKMSGQMQNDAPIIITAVVLSLLP